MPRWRRPRAAARRRPAMGAVDQAPVYTAATLTPERRRARRAAAWRRRRLVLLLMSPWIVGFCVFFAYPLISNAYLSLTHYDLLSKPRWIGLSNYRFLFDKDP